MKELWTGINNKNGETNYEIRFTTNSQKEYEVLRDACREVLDSDRWRIYEAVERLQKICKKSK